MSSCGRLKFKTHIIFSSGISVVLQCHDTFTYFDRQLLLALFYFPKLRRLARVFGVRACPFSPFMRSLLYIILVFRCLNQMWPTHVIPAHPRGSLQLLPISHSDLLICRCIPESTPCCASQCVTRAELQFFNLSKWLLPRLHHCKCQCVCFAAKRLYFRLDICSNGTNEVVFLWVNVQLCGRFARCRILVAALFLVVISNQKRSFWAIN